MSSSVGARSGDGIRNSGSESIPGHSDSEAFARLDELDRRHLARMLKTERLSPGFLRANLGIAAALVVYYSWSGSWTGVRAVLVLLILLAARAHLRQLRSARLLRKLVGQEAEPR